MNDVDSSVRNGRWRAVWHLLVAGAVVAAGVGVTATPAAASATAATAAVELTNLVAEDYHDPDRQLAVGGDVRISGEWSLPAGTAAGDAFTVTLPSEMRTVAGQKFRLTGAGDEVGTDYAVSVVASTGDWARTAPAAKSSPGRRVTTPPSSSTARIMGCSGVCTVETSAATSATDGPMLSSMRISPPG